MGQGQSEGLAKVNCRDPSPKERFNRDGEGELESIVPQNANFDQIPYVAANTDVDDTANLSSAQTDMSSRCRWPSCLGTSTSTGSQSSFGDEPQIQIRNSASEVERSECATVARDCSTADDDVSELRYCICRRISLPVHTARELGLAGKKLYCER